MSFFTHGSEFLTCKNKSLPQPDFSPVVQILTLQHQFLPLIDVWLHVNWGMVTNNLTTGIEVVRIDVTLVEGFLYRSYSASTAKYCCIIGSYIR